MASNIMRKWSSKDFSMKTNILYINKNCRFTKSSQGTEINLTFLKLIQDGVQYHEKMIIVGVQYHEKMELQRFFNEDEHIIHK